MELRRLEDQELLNQTKELVQRERQMLTKILHHLLEVERRRLFSDLGYGSLFQYCVKELRYSEGAAGRRIQAMREMRDHPELEQKIEQGKLTLSNICQAKIYFRESRRHEPNRLIQPEEMLKVFAVLENKSTREAEKELLKLLPERPLPKERERPITETHTEVSFIMSEALKCQLEEVRSLLGPKGASMSLADLVQQMIELSLQSLKEKQFGKKRVQASNTSKSTPAPEASAPSTPTLDSQAQGKDLVTRPNSTSKENLATRGPSGYRKDSPNKPISKSPRYISKATRYQVWIRDQGKCCRCGNQRNLNFDHIQSVALGGQNHADNLRLLCFQCNQRQAIKTFGCDKIRQHQTSFFIN